MSSRTLQALQCALDIAYPEIHIPAGSFRGDETVIGRELQKLVFLDPAKGGGATKRQETVGR